MWRGCSNEPDNHLAVFKEFLKPPPFHPAFSKCSDCFQLHLCQPPWQDNHWKWCQCCFTMHIIMSGCKCDCHDDSLQNVKWIINCKATGMLELWSYSFRPVEKLVCNICKPILALFSLLFGQWVPFSPRSITMTFCQRLSPALNSPQMVDMMSPPTVFPS